MAARLQIVNGVELVSNRFCGKWCRACSEPVLLSMVQGDGHVDGAARWLAGAVRILQKEVRELKSLLEERHPYEKEIKLIKHMLAPDVHAPPVLQIIERPLRFRIIFVSRRPNRREFGDCSRSPCVLCGDCGSGGVRPFRPCFACCSDGGPTCSCGRVCRPSTRCTCAAHAHVTEYDVQHRLWRIGCTRHVLP